MKKIDNVEELIVGSMVGAVYFYFMGLWTLLAIPLCAWLWWLGGAEGYSKGIRRLGVPVVICGLCMLNKWSWIPAVSIFPLFGVLTIGYGIPSFDEEGHCTDKGSKLGRFALWLVTGGKPFYIDKKAEDKMNFIVRGIIAALMGIAMGSLGFINLPSWAVASIGLVFLYPVVVNKVD